MKISLNWLKDYVNLPESLEISKLMYDLTMSTVEVEGASKMSEKFKNIVLGRIEEITPHPNADKLRICRTDTGEGEKKEIVCGGINLSEGMNAAVAKPGAFVRWHGLGDLVEIKKAKLRGVESYGMICASSEIGLFDLFPFDEEATIIDLSGFDFPPGTPLEKALDIDDVIFEIDNKSLTNRPDLWGHYGIAREISALYDLPLKQLPEASLPDSNGGLKIEIKDAERCARYLGLKIENVSAKPASFEIRSRIWRVGMRPINALVDITNYVMLAVGQPTHAFDSGNIAGGITVRRAERGEKLLLLNGRELFLAEEDLVIADDEEAVALAGVMGGSKDSILGDTTSVILEIANFSPLGIRRTSSRFDLRTEASVRYEKGIDPQRADQAAALASALFAREFPQMSITGRVDNYPCVLNPAFVKTSCEWLAKRMGKRIPNDNIRKMLERLGFTVEIEGDELRSLAPSWRSTGDISLPDDIMEEIARLYGYENFEQTHITTTFEHSVNQREHELERRIKEYLSFRCGMQEIFTYPWMKDYFISAASIPVDGMLQISTPPAPDERYIRSSLLPNLLRAVSENLRFFESFAIYELAQIFFDRDYAAPYDPSEELPLQRRCLAGALVGNQGEVSSLFRRAKGIVENMPRWTHMEPFSFGQRDKPAWADDTVWLDVLRGDKAVGRLSLLSKKSALAAGIKQSSVMILEIDIDSLAPLASRTNRFVRLPEYPQVEYDISMIFDEAIKWRDIENAVIGKKTQGDIVKTVLFIDEYRGRQIPPGKKSITLRLILGSGERTLTSADIEKTSSVITKRLVKQFEGELRTSDT
jgi:phenylalanyl-tRNA synthetase beta chain